MFRTVNRPVVGLDIGSSAVKMVSLRTDGDDGYDITAVAMSAIDSVGAVTAHSFSVAAITAIEDCLKSSMGGITRDSYFVFGLAGAKRVKVSSFDFTLLTLDEVAQAVMFEAVQVCPFDIRNSVVDYQLINIDDSGADGFGKKQKKKVHPSIKGVLAAATKEAISGRQKLAEDALLKCILIDSEGLALLNSFTESSAADEELPVAIINVGRSLTTIAILDSDGLPFIRDLEYSGSAILDHIAESCGTSAEQIQQQLFEGKGSSDFATNIDQACKKLILDVTETLTYYSSHHSGNSIERVYVCGGFSLFDDFVKVLAGGISSEVSLWNPFSGMHCDEDIAGGNLLKECGPALAVAAGLAMRHI